MNVKRTCLWLALLLIAPVAAMAGNLLGYGYGQISQPNSTVEVLSVNLDPRYYRGIGLKGIKCIFPSGDGGASVKIKITYGSTEYSFIVDPTFFQQESNGSGQFMSDWVPLPSGQQGGTTVLVQLNNTNLGTATISCWVTWGSFPQIE